MIFKKNYWYIAWAYIQTKHHDAHIQIMIKICFISIMLATCALSLMIAIMTGFEQATYQKMQSIYPDIIIQNQNNDYKQDEVFLQKFKEKNQKKIKEICNEKQMQGFLTPCFDTSNPAPINIKAIDAKQFNSVIGLQSKMICPKNVPLTDLLASKNIIIADQLARILDLHVGQEAFLIINEPDTTHFSMQFESYPVTIAGICKIGMQDFDTTMVIVDQTWFDSIQPNHDIDYWYIKLTKTDHDTMLIKDLKIAGYDAFSWKELYPSLCSALKLETYAMSIVLSLIILIAGMNMISLIHMMISQKKRDIALFLTFGMSIKAIRAIFITVSSLIAASATSLGLTISYIIAVIFQKYPCIKLPDNVYDTDYLPINIDWITFLLIFILTMVIIYVTSMFATKNISKIHIIEVLKHV